MLVSTLRAIEESVPSEVDEYDSIAGTIAIEEIIRTAAKKASITRICPRLSFKIRLNALHLQNEKLGGIILYQWLPCIQKYLRVNL